MQCPSGPRRVLNSTADYIKTLVAELPKHAIERYESVTDAMHSTKIERVRRFMLKLLAQAQDGIIYGSSAQSPARPAKPL